MKKTSSLFVLGLLLATFIAPLTANATSTAPLSGGATISIYSTNLSTSPATILTQDGARKFLQIQNTSAANTMSCTLDGTTPTVNGNGVNLSPLGSATYDSYVPTGALTCVGSAASTAYTINYLP